MKRNTYTCPVCGYNKLEEPPYDEFGCPTYVIYSCCGFEFRFDDEAEGSSFSEYRQRWIDKGFPFFNSKKKPLNWNERVMPRKRNSRELREWREFVDNEPMADIRRFRGPDGPRNGAGS